MEFSPEQKSFLKKFVSYEQEERGTKCDCRLIIFTLVEADIFRLDRQSNTLRVYPSTCKPESAFEWMFFFKFLEKERYLYFLENSGTNSTDPSIMHDLSKIQCRDTENNILNAYTSMLPVGEKDNKYFTLDGNPVRIGTDDRVISTKQVGELNEFIKKSMFPTHKLKELVNNDFKTPEELRFNKQIKKTNGALYISIVALVASTIVGIVGFSRNSDVNADAQQHKELINAIQSTLLDTTQIETIKPTPQKTNLKKEIEALQ